MFKVSRHCSIKCMFKVNKHHLIRALDKNVDIAISLVDFDHGDKMLATHSEQITTVNSNISHASCKLVTSSSSSVITSSPVPFIFSSCWSPSWGCFSDSTFCCSSIGASVVFGCVSFVVFSCLLLAASFDSLLVATIVSGDFSVFEIVGCSVSVAIFSDDEHAAICSSKNENYHKIKHLN